jgi:murein DD-endopeptidase MepM/ murein hydrolase activator NlpD
MPPKETNKNSVGRAKPVIKSKDTTTNKSTNTSPRPNTSIKQKASRSNTRKTFSSKPVDGGGGPGSRERIKPPTFKFPVAGGEVTQQVGAPNKRQGYASNRNEGLDIAGALGDPIIAGAGGTVIGIEKDAGAWGNRVVIDYGGGRQGAYNHLSGFGDIKVGQRVGADDVIGQIGRTGNTTGPHLDFETTLNGTSAPLASVFKGYQFDPAFGGSEIGVSDKGYNRKEKKFYDLDDLSGSSGGYTPSPTSSYTPTSSTTPSTTPFTTPTTTPSTNVNSTGSKGFSSGQFVNLGSLATPSLPRGMSKIRSPFSKSFSSSITPIKSTTPKMTNFSKNSVGSPPSEFPTSKVT